jgi:gamma-tubulin complex component 5
LHRIRNPQLRKEEILDEEPFEGQHWEGVYGLPPGSTVEGWETMSLESTPPLSPLDDERLLLPSHSAEWGIPTESDNIEHFTPPSPLRKSSQPLFYDHRQDVETLQLKQYWRKGGHMSIPTEAGGELSAPLRFDALPPLITQVRLCYEPWEK